jgi:hypothetical protein
MIKGMFCPFCNKPATEWHHIAGRHNCNWLVVPVCTAHHRLITKAYRNTNPAMMKHPTSTRERIIHAIEACLTFVWLLMHPELIDPTPTLVNSAQLPLAA